MKFPLRRPASMGPRMPGRETPEAQAAHPEDHVRGNAVAGLVQSERGSTAARGANAIL